MNMLNFTASERDLKKRIYLCLGLCGLFALLFVFGLVQNSRGAVERYDRLIAADQAGGDVESALNELRSYVYTHMNAEVGKPDGIYPPIQLSGTYGRLVAAEEARVQDLNGELYSEAQTYCETSGPQGFSGGTRLECINAFVDERGAKAQPIDESFYTYDFVSPRWSPDFAGISLLLCGASLIALVVYLGRYGYARWLTRSIG